MSKIKSGLLLTFFLCACSSNTTGDSIPDDVKTFSNDVGQEDAIIQPDKSDAKLDAERTHDFSDVLDSYMYLRFASMGSECSDDLKSRYFVLSDAKFGCSEYSDAVQAYLNGEEILGVVVFEENEREVVKRYCFTDGTGCEEVSFSVQEDGESGNWQASIRGVERSRSFEIHRCEETRLTAKDISITDVAIYQAVKIPIISDTQFVEDRNAPIIAGRPALLRVFVAPSENWQAREIVAKLTLGDLEREARLRPIGISNEGDQNTTFVFDFEKGDLPMSGNFSVELFENNSCTNSPGEEGVTKLPRTEKELSIHTLNKSLDVVLVPMIYNFDNSGRTPNLDAATVKTYSDLMYEYYPIEELNISVRAPVAYDQLLGSRGSGFPAAINFCLNLRQVDGVADDVFYYCVFKPADTFNEYCGFFGCRAGQSLIPTADEVESRGAVGVSFPNLAAETFVHEIGHAMGRYHTPCGNAPVPDPNYPYAGGSIGSYGYSVFSKLVLDATANKDFMAYCKPAWVSDYTYANLFTRLDSILGSQQGRISGPAKKWRSAIVETDGSLSWSIGRELNYLPAGQKIRASLNEGNGKLASNIDVYVRPMSDSNAAILTVESVEQVGWIHVDGYGRIFND